jgi:ketosteroid isomerase-like protein
MNIKMQNYPKILTLALLLIMNLANINISHAANTQQLTDNNKQAQASTHPELDNIKKVLNETVEAINLRSIEKISPHFSEDFALITLENKKITPRQAFLDYWNNLFKGDKATVKNLTLEIQIDPEPIYIDSKIAILQGTAIENFTYFKGDNQILHTRWTAILEKKSQKQSQWIISAIHHSSGITKSMLNKLQSQLFKTALGGLVIGLVLGMLIISLSRKSKHR